MSTIAVMIALGGTGYAATQLGRGSVTSRAIKDGAVHTADLANHAVSSRKLANNAVTGAKIAGGAVTESNIAGGSLTGSAFKCQPGDAGLDNRNMCFFKLHASQGTTWIQAVSMCRARGSTPAILASPAEIAAEAPLGGGPFRSVLLWSSQIASSTGAFATASAWAVQTDADGKKRKAAALSAAYDMLETRIAALRAAEELDAIRPDLDGNEIMAVLGIPPGPLVGKAYKFLLALRMEDGPLGHDRAVEELTRWYAQQQR